jgi:hypothetical protein
MEEFLPLENSSNELEQDNHLETDRERIKHLLVGSPKVVKRTIYLLHSLGYAEAKRWSRPQIAGSLGQPGEVVSILIRNILSENQLRE